MKTKMSKKKIVRVFINLIIIGLVLFAYIFMTLRKGGELSSTGVAALKYFTVESNLFAGLTSIIWIAYTFTKRKNNQVIERLKYISAVSVFLTFIVVVAFLAPLYGFDKMYTNANLYFHLIVPILAVVDFVFFSECSFTKKDNILCIIFPLIYGVFYILNILINGIGKAPNYNDWYGFLNWGIATGAIIFILILLLVLLLGLLIRITHKIIYKNKR